VCAIAERGDPGQIDVVTPYGFGGFVGTGVSPEMLDDWAEFARARGYICGYVGLNPALMPPVVPRSRAYTEHNDVYLLELGRGVEALQRGMSTNRRRQVRSFGTGGERLLDDRERLGGWFQEHVGGFLREKGATSAYEFTHATWAALLDLDQLDLLGVESPDGDVVAVSVFASTPYCAEYLFGISQPAGRTFSAAVIWAAAVKLAEQGIPRLNLGGGVRRGDGVAEFKERFGATRLPLGALKQVYRLDEYEALCRRAGTDPADRTGYFPAYRRPGSGITEAPMPGTAGLPASDRRPA
jgi:hypothetical protein